MDHRHSCISEFRRQTATGKRRTYPETETGLRNRGTATRRRFPLRPGPVGTLWTGNTRLGPRLGREQDYRVYARAGAETPCVWNTGTLTDLF